MKFAFPKEMSRGVLNQIHQSAYTAHRTLVHRVSLRARHYMRETSDYIRAY